MNKPQPVMAKKGNAPWEVEVYVYLKSESKGDFTIESLLKSETNDRLEFKNCNHDGFWVKFYLIDQTGKGYTFPDTHKDGIWSQMGTTCPSGPVWGVFPEKKIDVKDQGTTLVAFNPNVAPAVGDFMYTLNVTRDGNMPYLPLDPGGTNHNGLTTRAVL